MRQKGVVGNANVIERIVHVEDKEKMAEIEERLNEEKKEIARKAQEDSERIQNQANLQKEEKSKILDEIKKRE